MFWNYEIRLANDLATIQIGIPATSTPDSWIIFCIMCTINYYYYMYIFYLIFIVYSTIRSSLDVIQNGTCQGPSCRTDYLEHKALSLENTVTQVAFKRTCYGCLFRSRNWYYSVYVVTTFKAVRIDNNSFFIHSCGSLVSWIIQYNPVSQL